LDHSTSASKFRFATGLDFVARWCAYIGSSLFIILTVIICYDVIARKFFNSPTNWAVDFSEYIMSYATFLGVAWILKKGAHIKIGIVEELLSPGWRRAFTYFTDFIGVLVCAVIVWQSSLATWDAYTRHIVIPRPIEVPKFAVLVIIPFASLLLMLYFIVRLAVRPAFAPTEKEKIINNPGD
jgi:C4-dicarboxylate transporter, DctQ subunit